LVEPMRIELTTS